MGTFPKLPFKKCLKNVLKTNPKQKAIRRACHFGVVERQNKMKNNRFMTIEILQKSCSQARLGKKIIFLRFGLQICFAHHKPILQ